MTQTEEGALEVFKTSENADMPTTEIVLMTSLSKFKSLPTEDKIIWNFSQIIPPSVVTINNYKVRLLPIFFPPISEPKPDPQTRNHGGD